MGRLRRLVDNAYACDPRIAKYVSLLITDFVYFRCIPIKVEILCIIPRDIYHKEYFFLLLHNTSNFILMERFMMI